ncbi:MAG: FkbM family methyltransferase [Verrucomicrobiota bacterium]|nr:FkbM family methyltransferase [Verrucomicrobiota bacterium]MDQ6940136.1 FkbM family methyltransferase [Verrucomicrobiota bacterium]
MDFAKMRSVAQLFFRRNATRGVSTKWLFKTHTRLLRSFLRHHTFEVEKAGDFTYLRVDRTPFVWPANADLEPLKNLLAELLIPDHPHQYDYGLTRLSPREVLLDVGCCEGGFAAKAAAGGATVIAVEPSRRMSGVIRRLFELRGLPSPTIKECLLGSRSGEACFQENEEDPAQSRFAETKVPNSYPISLSTIDQLVAGLEVKPTYLKCDAEGADFGILQGGREFLQEFRPKIAITTYHASEDFVRMRDYLVSLGYKVEGKGLIYIGGELRVVMIHAA